MRRLLAVHLGEETRDRIGPDRNIDGREQLANEPEGCAFLPQFYNAVFKRHQLGLTARRRQFEVANGFVEALGARGGFCRFAHTIASGLAAGRKSLSLAKGEGVPSKNLR